MQKIQRQNEVERDTEGLIRKIKNAIQTEFIIFEAFIEQHRQQRIQSLNLSSLDLNVNTMQNTKLL